MCSFWCKLGASGPGTVSSQSPCNVVLVGFLLLLPRLLLGASGLSQAKRWLLWPPGASRPPSAGGVGAEAITSLSPDASGWREAGMALVPHRQHGRPQQRDRDRAQPWEPVVHHCAAFPRHAMWSAALQLFGVYLPVSWYFRPLAYEYEGFQWWGQAENEVGGKVRKTLWRAAVSWALLLWQRLSFLWSISLNPLDHPGNRLYYCCYFSFSSLGNLVRVG